MASAKFDLFPLVFVQFENPVRQEFQVFVGFGAK